MTTMTMTASTLERSYPLERTSALREIRPRQVLITSASKPVGESVQVQTIPS